MSDENAKQQAQTTSAEPTTQQDDRKQPAEQRVDRNRFYTVDTDNPLICRGID
jgi:hypothetical protein